MRKEDYFIKVNSELLAEKSVSLGAKLLYGYIESLAKQNGYCYATNQHLATRLGVSDRSITRYLTELDKAQFVQAQYVEGKTGIRVRCLLPVWCPKGETELSRGDRQNCRGGVDKTVHHDKKIYNKIYNIYNITNSTYKGKFTPKLD